MRTADPIGKVPGPTPSGGHCPPTDSIGAPRDPWRADARMDPWCTVPVIGGGQVLYGYAVDHPATGGRSWVASTTIRWIDDRIGRAMTASGRHYDLGRRLELEDIPSEGDEAWLAFDLLLGDDVADQGAVPRFSADHDLDVAWVTACKMARHLGLEAPGRAPREVIAFHRAHEAAYRIARLRGRRS